MTPVSLIADKVAPEIQMTYPNDQDRVFSYLSFVQKKIWNSGLFHNSTAFFHVNLDEFGNIITPHGYNVLLGCNVDFRPITITSQYSLFHANGDADASLRDKNFSQEVTYLGESPVTIQPNDSWFKSCNSFISVLGSSCESKKFTDISALGKNGKPIYTYYKETRRSSKLIVCGEEKLNSDNIDVRNGVRYAITNTPQFHKNIIVTQINGIFKDQTLGPVEYYLNSNGLSRLVARLEPFETHSSYKRYKVSGRCVRKNQVLGLFKMSEPIDIISESQYFISSNLEAIILIAKGFKMKFDKEDQQAGESFIQDGIKALREEIRGNRVNTIDRLQIKVESKIRKTNFA